MNKQLILENYGVDLKENMLRNLEEKLKETGYPLEIEVSNELERSKWLVSNNVFFEDEKGPKEIDVIAYREDYFDFSVKNLAPIFLNLKLLIECKKSNLPWVFFTRPFDSRTFPLATLGHEMDFTHTFSKNFDVFSSAIIVPLISPNLHYRKFNRVASSYTDRFRIEGRKIVELSKQDIKEKEHTTRIFHALKQIKGYLNYYFNNIIETPMDLLAPEIVWWFLTIVFDGPLVEAVVHKNRVKARNQNHILLRSTYSPTYTKRARNLLVDIVKKEQFTTYLKEIETDIELQRKEVKRNKSKILKKRKSLAD